MTPISKITLDQLYEHINKALKGSYLHNDDVEITARVKLTALPLAGSLPSDLIVPLKITGVTAKIEDIPQHERDSMSGMYPPTRRAKISIDCEVATGITDEHKGS